MRGYTFMFLNAICFAIIGTVVNLIVDVSIFAIAFYRFFFGAIALAIILPFLDRNFLKVSKKDIPHFAIIGLLLAINFPLFNVAFLNAPVSNVFVLGSIFPIFVLVLAAVFLKEKARRIELVALLIALFAILIMNPMSGGYALGNTIALVNAFTFAVLIVYLRYEDRNHSIGYVFWFILFGAILSLPTLFLYGFGDVMGNLHWLILLGAVSTGVAYIFLGYALKVLKAETASLISVTTGPLLGILIALLVLGQVPSAKIIFGGALLIFSAALVVKKPGKRHHILKPRTK
jgi:drug/metabolite transporter (DMT)-like permease